MLWFRRPEHSCTTFTMFKLLNLVLLLCLFDHSETASKLVTGLKGGDVTLTYEPEARDIVYIDLSRLKSILSCQNEECEIENDRVFKKGSCDIIIKDLRLRDAGKYFLRVYYDDDGQAEVDQQILEYQLCIQDEISVKKGEELTLNVLLPNADKVEHLAKRSTGQKEVWTRGHGVRSDRMTFRDGNLIIHNFTATDAGTYEVLDSEGEILIMVTVTESVSYINDDKTYNTQHSKKNVLSSPLPGVKDWIVPVGLPVLLLALILVAVKRRKMHRCSGAQLHIY